VLAENESQRSLSHEPADTSPRHHDDGRTTDHVGDHLPHRPKPLKLSASFLTAVAIAATVGVAIFLTLANNFSLGDSSDNGSTGHIIQYLLVGLLVFLAIKNYLGRETIEPPSWLGTLQNAKPSTAFKTGLLLISLMPSDLIIMMTVGTNL
jgi:hypothetical protein